MITISIVYRIIEQKRGGSIRFTVESDVLKEKKIVIKIFDERILDDF